MSPCQFFLEFVGLMPLLSSFGCLLKASQDLFIVGLEVWNCFLLTHEDLGSLGDIFEACLVLFTELTKLGTTEEELQTCEARAVKPKDTMLALYLSDGWEELRNCLAASGSHRQV